MAQTVHADRAVAHRELLARGILPHIEGEVERLVQQRDGRHRKELRELLQGRPSTSRYVERDRRQLRGVNDLRQAGEGRSISGPAAQESFSDRQEIIAVVQVEMADHHCVQHFRMPHRAEGESHTGTAVQHDPGIPGVHKIARTALAAGWHSGTTAEDGKMHLQNVRSSKMPKYLVWYSEVRGRCTRGSSLRRRGAWSWKPGAHGSPGSSDAADSSRPWQRATSGRTITNAYRRCSPGRIVSPRPDAHRASPADPQAPPVPNRESRRRSPAVRPVPCRGRRCPHGSAEFASRHPAVARQRADRARQHTTARRPPAAFPGFHPAPHGPAVNGPRIGDKEYGNVRR